MAAHRRTENSHRTKGKNKAEIKARLKRLAWRTFPERPPIKSCTMHEHDIRSMQHVTFSHRDTWHCFTCLILCEFFLKFNLLFSHMYFKLFDYNSIFQYSVKRSINDLEINSINEIHFQKVYDNVG